MIHPEKLGIYAPKTGEKIRLAQEAQRLIKEAIYEYKKLFYGLRRTAWMCRDAKAIFYDALSNDELEQFKIAPGHRLCDGSYSRDEWDYDRLNLYLWERFAQQFEEAFSLEKISTLKTYKDIRNCKTQLLEFALDNWGEMLLSDRLLEEDPDDPKLHQQNLELIKAELLRINQDHWEERQARHVENQPKTRPVNETTLADKRQQEAEEWLATHPEFADSEIPF